jgi:hypothetical protein
MPNNTGFKVLFGRDGTALGVETDDRVKRFGKPLAEYPIENVTTITIEGVTITKVTMTVDSNNMATCWVHHSCRRLSSLSTQALMGMIRRESSLSILGLTPPTARRFDQLEGSIVRWPLFLS